MERRCVLVIGMHRSGTSLTMQALDALGVRTGGDLIASDEFNARGYFEPTEIVAIHDEIFTTLDRGWGQPEHLLPIPDNWWDTPYAQAAEEQLAAALESRLARIGFGETLAIKDPRLSLVLPLWLRIARHRQINLRLILCLRHPTAVARSLEARDRISAPMSEALWFTYTTACLAACESLPLYLSRYDDWLERSDDCLMAIARFINHPAPARTTIPFERDLAHHLAEKPPLDPLVARRWEELAALPFGQTIAPQLIRQAQDDLRVVRHMEILARAIRAEVGDTLSYRLERDLAALRKGLHEAHAAYKAEAETSATLRETVAGLEAALRDHVARVDEAHAAYKAEAETSATLREALSDRQAALAAALTRADEFLAAYQEEAARAEDLRRKLALLNPMTWLPFPRRRS